MQLSAHEGPKHPINHISTTFLRPTVETYYQAMQHEQLKSKCERSKALPVRFCP